MTVTFAVLTLSYYVLTADDFALFNLLVFFFALGSALAAPLNRAFWAANSPENFGPASGATGAIVCVVVVGGLIFTGPSSSIRLVLAAAGAIYGVAKVLERYAYGRMLVAGESAWAVLPAIIFVSVEAGVVAAMWIFKSKSLLLRIIVPALLFLTVAALTRLKPLLQDFWRALRDPRASLEFARSHLISHLGAQVIAIGGLATIAGMGERLLIKYLPLATPEASAAYLLVLSYAVAFQTLSSFLFDLSRARVFRDGSWQPQARRFSLISAGLLVAVIGAAGFAYPLLRFLHVIPDGITQLLWVALLMRSSCLTLILTLNVDKFQQGTLLSLAVSNVIVLVGAVVSFGLLHEGFSQLFASLTLIGACCITTAVNGVRFFQRIGSLESEAVGTHEGNPSG
ncbi:MAG: hypothetical protein H0W71_01520 [Sphingomonas sp.]|nr:hypothetical protein [Sphingomonas sp.]